MEKTKKRARPHAVVAVLLLLLTAALWVFLFFPHQSIQELPGQARRSAALDYDVAHGGLHLNGAVYLLAAEGSTEREISSLCARIYGEAVPMTEGLYLVRFDAPRSSSELDGIALWLEESPLVEAAFLGTLSRSPFAGSGVEEYETHIPLLEQARSLWENERTLVVAAGALVMAVSILLPTILCTVRWRKTERKEERE